MVAALAISFPTAKAVFGQNDSLAQIVIFPLLVGFEIAQALLPRKNGQLSISISLRKEKDDSKRNDNPSRWCTRLVHYWLGLNLSCFHIQ